MTPWKLIHGVCLAEGAPGLQACRTWSPRTGGGVGRTLRALPMRHSSKLWIRSPGRTHEPSSRAKGVRRMGKHAGVRRVPCSWAVGKMAPCRAGAAGATEDRGDDDAGAHARHMRRRTQGLCQLTSAPRSISRLSSASLQSSAACHMASPIESLIASAALIRPAPARPPADSGGGHARGSAVTLGRRRRALRRGAHVPPTGPSELGWRRQPWREGASRTLGATTARSRGCRNAWLPRPRTGGMGWYGCAKQLAPEAPIVCEAGHRAPRGHWAIHHWEMWTYRQFWVFSL
jgi:hypothetical protein